ncbi:MAG: hypothetical protein IPO64_17740 [Bacteroidetes bacterium]|nr:hypothetical protein [Bacteroidota bacterium]
MEKAKQHGHIRGWVKTDESGKTPFTQSNQRLTQMKICQLIFILLSKNPILRMNYYIEAEFVFDDDKLLTGEKAKARKS